MNRPAGPARRAAAGAVARTIDHAVARQRLEVTGTVTAIRTLHRGGPRTEVDLADGTGVLTLIFFGRRGLPGLHTGSCLVVEAVVADAYGRLEAYNPTYRFVE
jgi:hypothetical protein